MKKIAIVVSFALVAFLSVSPVFASNNNQNNQDIPNGVRHYGPFAGSSPDSGTCGNNWANDTFKRHFFINQANPTIVTEEFKNGHFVTVAGASPGGCDTNPGGTVGAGVKGTFKGSFTIVVSGGTYNRNALCTQATCGTTAKFIATVYGSSATYDIPTFEFHYNAGPNGAWTNASADRGGNKGDITGSPLPRQKDDSSDDTQ